MNIGDRVRISGDVYYGNQWIRVSSYGTLEHIGIDGSLVNIDMIDGDSNACVIVKNKYIHKEAV